MGEDSCLEVRQVIGEEIFVGVERGGPVGGGEGGAVCGGEDGFDEVFGGSGLADDGQRSPGDRSAYQVRVVAGGVDDDGNCALGEVCDVAVRVGAVGEAQVEDGDLSPQSLRVADGRGPAD